MSAGPRCPSCARENSEIARFCRACGADLAFALPASAEDRPSAPAPELVDGSRAFTELVSICGALIAISIAHTIYVAVSGDSPYVLMVAVAADSLVAIACALGNLRLVGSGLRIPDLAGFGYTLLVACVGAPGLLLGFWILNLLGFPPFRGYFDSFVQYHVPITDCFIAIAVVTPIGEELLFRGVIQPKLGRMLEPREALIVQAAVFSAMHLQPVILVTHFFMGLGFGFLRQRTRSIFPGILLHAAWNAFVLWASLSALEGAPFYG